MERVAMAEDNNKGGRKGRRMVLTIEIGPLQIVKGTGMLGIMFFLNRCAQVCADLLRSVHQ
jgi:hypothetical protein